MQRYFTLDLAVHAGVTGLKDLGRVINGPRQER